VSATLEEQQLNRMQSESSSRSGYNQEQQAEADAVGEQQLKRMQWGAVLSDNVRLVLARGTAT